MSVWEELAATPDDGFEAAAYETLLADASALLLGLASTEDEDRLGSIDHGDVDELRAVVYAAADGYAVPRGAAFVGKRLGKLRCWEKLIAERDDEEIRPAQCRERFDAVLRHGDQLVTGVAQLRPSRRLRRLSEMHPDDVRCAALSAAFREEQSWSL